jgi:hypothetical protein
MRDEPEAAEEKLSVVMCAACWKIQVPKNELAFETDHWVDPTTFMAQVDGGAAQYDLMDGYCDPCLTQFVCRLQDAKMKTACERLNA